VVYYNKSQKGKKEDARDIDKSIEHYENLNRLNKIGHTIKAFIDNSVIEAEYLSDVSDYTQV
jgi:hypothetical protein